MMLGHLRHRGMNKCLATHMAHMAMTYDSLYYVSRFITSDNCSWETNYNNLSDISLKY